LFLLLEPLKSWSNPSAQGDGRGEAALRQKLYSNPIIISSANCGRFFQMRTRVLVDETGDSNKGFQSIVEILTTRVGVAKRPSKAGFSPGSTSCDRPNVTFVSPSTSGKHATRIHDCVAVTHDGRGASGTAPFLMSDIPIRELVGATLIEAGTRADLPQSKTEPRRAFSKARS
jgi:hypothetical protein